MDDSSLPISQPNEIGLLDILVTLTENIKLLIIGPLAAGLLVFGISFAWPKTFESVAVLQADAVTASLMTTAAVLDPVAQSLGLRKDATAEKSREELRSRIKVSVGRNDKLITLSVSGETPAKAQDAANALLEATYLQSQPRGSQKARLEKQLIEAQTRLKTARAATDQLAQSISVAARNTSIAAMSQASQGLEMLAGGSASLLEASAAAQKQIVELEAVLEGLTAAQLIQAPTLPERAVSPKAWLNMLISVLGSAILFAILIFIRSTICGVKDAESKNKLNRIYRALGLNREK